MKRTGIKIEGYKGTWYIIDESVADIGNIYLLESEQWGEDVASLIVDKDYNIILEDVCNGLDEY